MLDAIDSATIGANKASAKHGVPPTTLKDHLSRRVKHGTKSGPVPYSSQEEEKELTDHLLVTAQSHYGKTCCDVMNMVENYVNCQNPSRLVSISNGGTISKREIHSLVSEVEIQQLAYE